MKKLLLVLAVAAASPLPVASAGGWATVGLGSLPAVRASRPNQTWPVDITVLQHGETPLAGVTPIVRIRDGGGKVVKSFTATPTGQDRRLPRRRHASPARARTPTRSTTASATYGGAQTHTFKPVEIGAPGDSFPYLPLGLAVGARPRSGRRDGRLPAAPSRARHRHRSEGGRMKKLFVFVATRRRRARARRRRAGRLHGHGRAQLDAEAGPRGGQAVGRHDPRPPARPHADVATRSRRSGSATPPASCSRSRASRPRPWAPTAPGSSSRRPAATRSASTTASRSRSARGCTPSSPS